MAKSNSSTGLTLTSTKNTSAKTSTTQPSSATPTTSAPSSKATTSTTSSPASACSPNLDTTQPGHPPSLVKTRETSLQPAAAKLKGQPPDPEPGPGPDPEAILILDSVITLSKMRMPPNVEIYK